jgi:hypothetical protein
MKTKDPEDAKKFEKVARRIVADYREHAAWYLEIRGKSKV